MSDDWTDIPGAELVTEGLADLASGRVTDNALLVAIGAPRLRWIGVAVPEASERIEHPELALYERLCAAGRRDAHAAYNALIARLVSFERELERREFRRRRMARAAGV